MSTKDFIMGMQVAGSGTGSGGGTVVVPNINATATTLPAGSDATVTKSGSNTNVMFAFGIPQGNQGNQGPTGAQGPVGATGPKGETGTQGATGPAGPQGEQGEAGATGPQGPAGPAGPAGQTGPQGPTGLQGPQGEQGAPFLISKIYDTYEDMNNGYATDGLSEGQLVAIATDTGGSYGGWIYAKGPTQYDFFYDISTTEGIQGPPGPQGEQGPQGEKGPVGPVGPQGEQGIQGETGATGPQGPTGATGPAGATGATGPEGPQGPAGPQGEQGVQGPQGPAGPQGPVGQGVPSGGTTGQVLVKSSNNDYETEWENPTDLGIIPVLDIGSIDGTPPVQISLSPEQVAQSQLENTVVQAVYQGITLHLQKIGQSASQVVFSGFASNSNIFFFVNIANSQGTFNIVAVSGGNYTAGDGIEISGQTIQAKISTQGDNATGILNGGIYTPATFQTTVKPMISVSTVPATPDVQVTASKGDLSVSGTTGADGKVELEVTAFGVWIVSGVVNDKQLSETVVVSAIQTYTAQLTETNVFGVSWDTTNPSPQLVRLTPATDPNGVVTRTITTEPSPATGSGSGSSPFDSFMPWSGMEQYNIIDGVVSYKQGDGNFSRTLYDTMVYIPPFYYRREQDGNNQLFYIGDSQFSGSTLHPGSGRYVSRYQLDENYISKSGGQPINNVSITDARPKITGKANGYFCYDFATYCAITLLYIVEFANLYSQNVLGNGVTGSVPNVLNGETDIMNYHTGSVSGGYSAIQYRWIENIFGNYWSACDGINRNDRDVYVSTNYKNYSSDTYDGDYINIGISFVSSSAQYFSSLILSQNTDWAILPDLVGGSSSTYLTDGGYITYQGSNIFLFGAEETTGELSGMFSVASNQSSSEGYEYMSFRSCFVQEVIE